MLERKEILVISANPESGKSKYMDKKLPPYDFFNSDLITREGEVQENLTQKDIPQIERNRANLERLIYIGHRAYTAQLTSPGAVMSQAESDELRKDIEEIKLSPSGVDNALRMLTLTKFERENPTFEEFYTAIKTNLPIYDPSPEEARDNTVKKLLLEYTTEKPLHSLSVIVRNCTICTETLPLPINVSVLDVDVTSDDHLTEDALPNIICGDCVRRIV